VVEGHRWFKRSTGEKRPVTRDENNNDNSSEKLKEKPGSYIRKTFDRFTAEDSYTWNMSLNTESTAV
jgi:hypothetical protein